MRAVLHVRRMIMRAVLAAIVLSVTVLVSACVAETVVPGMPVADAGTDQVVDMATQVTLNGSGSFDPEQEPLVYQWSLLAVPYQVAGASLAVTLSDADSQHPYFNALDPGTYVAGLRVQAGKRSSVLDSVTVVALDTSHKNTRPVADAGVDTRLCPGETGLLIGNGSFDPDDDPLVSFLWKQVPTGAPTVEINAADQKNTSFVVPNSDPTPEPLRFRLTVSDGELDASDTVDVQVQVVVARPSGPQASVEPGGIIILDGMKDGNKSCYPATASLSWLWTQVFQEVGEATVSLNNVTQEKATGIAPIGENYEFLFQLTITADGDSDSDRVSVSVTSS